MPDYTEKDLHRRAAEFYQRIAVTDSIKWEKIEDIGPQLRAYEHLIRGNDCRSASKVIETVSFHLLAWGFFDRLIEMRQQLKKMAENADCEKSLDAKSRNANEGGLGLACLFGGRPHEASAFFMGAHLAAKAEAAKAKPRSASRQRWKAAQGKWLGYLAWSETYKGQIADGTALSNEALDLADETKDKVHKALWQHQLGWLNLDYYQNAAEAHRHLSAAVAEMGKLSKSSEARQNRIYFYPIWALGESDLGRTYALLGHCGKAEDHFRNAIEKFRQVKHRRFGRGALPGNIGSLLRDKGFSAQAKEIYEAVIKNQHEIGDVRGEQISYARLGSTHRDLGWRALLSKDLADAEAAEREFQSAIKCFDKSVFVARKERDWRRLTTGLRRLGNVYREMSLLCRMAGKSGERKAAMKLALKYHTEAHRIAPSGFIIGAKNNRKDELWEEYYDWLEQTRLILERQSSKPSFPPVTKSFLKQAKSKIPELLMGVVLLRANGAYDNQGHKVTSAKKAFEAARNFAKNEKRKIGDPQTKTKDLRRKHELMYAIATAYVGLAMVEKGKTRKEHQIKAEKLLREQIKEFPSPGFIREVSDVLLMMQDSIRGDKRQAEEHFIVNSALDILRLGLAGDNFQNGSSEQQLCEECWSLFPKESRHGSDSSAD